MDFPIGLIREKSVLKDNKILLSSRQYFQLWNIETGEVILEGKTAASFIFIDFTGILITFILIKFI